MFSLTFSTGSIRSCAFQYYVSVEATQNRKSDPNDEM